MQSAAVRLDTSTPSSGVTGRLQPPGISPQTTRDETLTSFYERGIAAKDWEIFHHTDPIRIVYVGDSTANLHHLVQTENPANRLHFPFPPIKPYLPWKPDPQQSTSGAYLSNAITQDLVSFPTRDVRDALVQTYLDDIHPLFPVVDQEEFKRQYCDPSNPPPLLLFHAVLLAAARISDHPMVGPVRPTVTATLFRRAKALFDLRHENDRAFLVQAALLMAWHVEDSDTISSGSYYWSGQASRIALGLGMHRDLTVRSTSLMPGFDRRQYRRLFWLVLQSEAMIALEHGRPPTIRLEDYDQPHLSDDEHRNFDNSPDNSIAKSYFLLNSELGELTLELLALNAPRQQYRDTTAFQSRLTMLTLRLPRGQGFEACQLRIICSLLSLVFHRGVCTADAATIAREAASTILTTLETMLVAGAIRRCTFHCSTPLLAAALQFFQDVKSAVSAMSLMRANAAHAQLERLMRPIDALSKYWPHVEALSKLCVSLCSRCSTMISDATTQRPDVDGHNDIAFPSNADIPWQDVMAGYQVPDLRQIFGNEEWMNSF